MQECQRRGYDAITSVWCAQLKTDARPILQLYVTCKVVGQHTLEPMHVVNAYKLWSCYMCTITPKRPFFFEQNLTHVIVSVSQNLWLSR